MRILDPGHPTPEAIWRALVAVGLTLEQDYCVRVKASYDFCAGDGRMLRLTPESRNRWKVEMIDREVLTATCWALDETGLLQQVRAMRAEAPSVRPLITAY